MRPLEVTAFVLGAIPLAVAIAMIVRGLADLTSPHR